MADTAMRGTITTLNKNKGFGHLMDEDEVSRFFHARWVIPEMDFDTMRSGDQVEFTPDSNGLRGNGQQAMNVRRIK